MDINHVKRVIDYSMNINRNLLIEEEEFPISLESIAERYWDRRDEVVEVYEECKGMSKENINEHLLSEYKVDVIDIKEVSIENLSKLCAALHEMTPRRMGNIVGFLKSEVNTSYNQTKEYSRSNMKGNFKDILLNVFMLNKLCWNIPGSGQTVTSERTAFNKLMDKKSLEIASNIITHSSLNQDSEKYPFTGLVASIQALRFIGWNEVQIQNVSIELNLADVVYVEYETKPRKRNEAKNIRSVMMSRARKIARANKSNHVEAVIANELGWDK